MERSPNGAPSVKGGWRSFRGQSPEPRQVCRVPFLEPLPPLVIAVRTWQNSRLPLRLRQMSNPSAASSAPSDRGSETAGRSTPPVPAAPGLVDPPACP